MLHNEIQYVKYEELLQNFQVEYLWYDKVWIDPSDEETKLKEIKEMHKVYHNARYTIAIVSTVSLLSPGYHNIKMNKRQFWWSLVTAKTCYSFWMARPWTLLEVMMSRHILVVWANTSMFQHSLYTTDVPTLENMFSEGLLDSVGQGPGSVNQMLRETHFRTRTKPHDRIFAVINIFFTPCSTTFDINYDTDIKALFNSFYRTIALKDLSILCFQSNWASRCLRKKILWVVTIYFHGLVSPDSILRRMYTVLPTLNWNILAIPIPYGCMPQRNITGISLLASTAAAVFNLW